VSPQLRERLARIYSTGNAPIKKFGDIHSPLADLGFVNPDVCDVQFGGFIAAHAIIDRPRISSSRASAAEYSSAL
jgi:hypothetical protein